MYVILSRRSVALVVSKLKTHHSYWNKCTALVALLTPSITI